MSELGDKIRALKRKDPTTYADMQWDFALDRAAALADEHAATVAAVQAEADHQRENKNQAYRERNMLVALLASMFPSGIARTDIDGWNPEWHGCVYIDFPWGQASWHYHDSQADLFSHLPPYAGVWDGHTTDDKYNAIMAAARLGGFKATVAAAYEAAAQEADDVLDNSDAVSDHASAAPNSYGAGYDAGERAAAHTIAEAIHAMTDADAAAVLERVKTEARREGMREADDWQSDPAASAAWNAGCDFAMTALCKMLKVDPNIISWDAATEELEGDVLSVIGNIMMAAFGDDWQDAILAAAALDRIKAEAHRAGMREAAGICLAEQQRRTDQAAREAHPIQRQRFIAGKVEAEVLAELILDAAGEDGNG